MSLVTEVVSVLRNLASERDSGQLRDAVVLGLGTEEMKLDIGTVTVYRVIRLLSVDLLLRRPSDHLSGEDAIPTDVQVACKSMSHLKLHLMACAYAMSHHKCVRLCCHSCSFLMYQCRILPSMPFPIPGGGDAEYSV